MEKTNVVFSSGNLHHDCDSGAMRTNPQGEDICSLQSQLRGLWVLCLRSIVFLSISVYCLFLRATKDSSNNLEF